MTKVYSFDVFDTVLLRRVAAPSDVFRFVGKQIANDTGAIDNEHFIEHFVSARILAERKALASSATEDCTIDEIWIILRSMIGGLDEKFGPECELDAERDFLAPNPQIAEEIAKLRAKASRVIFVSDTYLPQEFVSEELIRYGIAQKGDGIYVSSAIGLTKRSGNLLRHVVSQELVSPSDVIHFGDNLHSDFVMPAVIGIQTKLYVGTRLNNSETAIVSDAFASAEMASMIAGSMRMFRLQASSDFDDVNAFVATFLGPLLLLWAAWVLGTARNDGVRRLYFAARDCYLLCEAAKVLAPQFGDIECRYFKVSRRSVLLPSAKEVSQAEMPWVTSDQPQFRQAVERVGLEWSEVAGLFWSVDRAGEVKSLCADEDWKEFWAALRTPPLHSLIKGRIQDCRKGILAYLKAEGLFDGTQVGIVDLGWLLAPQRALQKLLNDHSEGCSLRGYYLGLMLGRASPTEAGRVKAIFYEEPADRRAVTDGREIFKRAYLVEKILKLAPHGSIYGYRISGERVEPLSDELPPSQVNLIRHVEKAIREFCAKHQNEVTAYADETIVRELIDKLCRAWFATPNLASINFLLRASTHVDRPNPLPAVVQPLVDPWRLKEAAQNFLPRRLQLAFGLSIRGRLWSEASLIYTTRLSATLMRVSEMLRRNLGPRRMKAYWARIKKGLSDQHRLL